MIVDPSGKGYVVQVAHESAPRRPISRITATSVEGSSSDSVMTMRLATANRQAHGFEEKVGEVPMRRRPSSNLSKAMRLLFCLMAFIGAPCPAG